MTEPDAILLKALLIRQRVATLAVLVDEKPLTGLLPFVIRPDFSEAIIQASSLAKHTAGLKDNAPFSLLIHASDDSQSDPLQLARASLQGTVRQLPKTQPEYEPAKGLYLEKFPASENIFQMSDFNLYALTIQTCRFVAGFGAIYLVPVDKFKTL